MIWSTISKGMNLSIDYVLQPTSIWQEKILSNEEEKILKLDERFKNKQIEQEEYIILRNSYKKRIKGKI